MLNPQPYPWSFLNSVNLDTFDFVDSVATKASGKYVQCVAKSALMRDTVKCLIIDDDADDQEIFAMALYDMDLLTECRFFDDCVTALHTLNTDDIYTPDCIFMDINMPRMNGVECLEQLKNILKFSHVPVCIISTSADPSIVDRTKSLGALDFNVKPPAISTLSEMLERFIHLNVARRQ